MTGEESNLNEDAGGQEERGGLEGKNLWLLCVSDYHAKNQHRSQLIDDCLTTIFLSSSNLSVHYTDI